ncbi:short-chain dehydrogenase/reductase SDR, partial [mine drainage metagenome]
MRHTDSQVSDYHALLDYDAPADLLADRVILITGAAHGIGHAVALRYARHGAQLVLLDWDRAGLETLADRIAAQGSAEPVLCPADLPGSPVGGVREITDRIG